MSLDSAESLPTDSEIAPSSIGLRLPSVEGETPATDDGGVAGPSSGLEGASTSSSGEGSGPSARVVGESITIPSSHSVEEAGMSSESVPGTTGIEGDSSSPKEILGKFAVDWLDTLDKDEINLFLCYHLVDMLSFTETKAAK